MTYITILYILYNNLDHYPEFLIGDVYTANTLYSHSLIFYSVENIVENKCIMYFLSFDKSQ